MKNKSGVLTAQHLGQELWLEPIHNAGSEHVPALQELYENSFPEKERRRFRQLLHLLPEPDMHLLVLADAGQLAGMAVFWHFADLLYLEHLAVVPAYRGKGYGNALMQWLLQQPHQQLVLEVEKPVDEVTQKRVRFYTQLGFTLLPYPYLQPPYEPHGSFVPLCLMSKPAITTAADFAETATLIREKVYERFYEQQQ